MTMAMIFQTSDRTFMNALMNLTAIIAMMASTGCLMWTAGDVTVEASAMNILGPSHRMRLVETKWGYVWTIQVLLYPVTITPSQGFFK